MRLPRKVLLERAASVSGIKPPWVREAARVAILHECPRDVDTVTRVLGVLGERLPAEWIEANSKGLYEESLAQLVNISKKPRRHPSEVLKIVAAKKKDATK